MKILSVDELTDCGDNPFNDYSRKILIRRFGEIEYHRIKAEVFDEINHVVFDNVIYHVLEKIDDERNPMPRLFELDRIRR